MQLFQVEKRNQQPVIDIPLDFNTDLADGRAIQAVDAAGLGRCRPHLLLRLVQEPIYVVDMSKIFDFHIEKSKFRGRNPGNKPAQP